jgi:hypothetical protein
MNVEFREIYWDISRGANGERTFSAVVARIHLSSGDEISLAGFRETLREIEGKIPPGFNAELYFDIDPEFGYGEIVVSIKRFETEEELQERLKQQEIQAMLEKAEKKERELLELLKRKYEA